MAERIGGVDQVADLTRRKNGWGLIVGETVDQSGAVTYYTTETLIVGAEPNLAEFLPPDTFQGSLVPGPGEVIMEETVAENNGFGLGDTVTLRFQQTGDQAFTWWGRPTARHGPAWSPSLRLIGRPTSALT